jgi:hypothetical protein
LVGTDFFTAVCDDYIRAVPSHSGDVRNYVATFSDFLATHPSAASLVYLPDVARIEWGCHQVLGEPEAQRLDMGQLSDIAPEQLAQARIVMCRASILVSSRYPAISIWQSNQPDYGGNDCISLDAGAEYGLVLRELFEVTVHRLSAAEFAFLACSQHGDVLANALHAAQNISAEFELGHCLQRHIGNRAIGAIELRGQP